MIHWNGAGLSNMFKQKSASAMVTVLLFCIGYGHSSHHKMARSLWKWPWTWSIIDMNGGTVDGCEIVHQLIGGKHPGLSRYFGWVSTIQGGGAGCLPPTLWPYFFMVLLLGSFHGDLHIDLKEVAQMGPNVCRQLQSAHCSSQGSSARVRRGGNKT